MLALLAFCAWSVWLVGCLPLVQTLPWPQTQIWGEPPPPLLLVVPVWAPAQAGQQVLVV